jgi:hypothetical protein
MALFPNIPQERGGLIGNRFFTMGIARTVLNRL